MDAVEVAGRFGINANRAVRYECDREGTELNFEVMSQLISCARSAGSADEMYDMFEEDEMLAPIRANYKKRHKA